MKAVILGTLLASLMGSLHCVGMCGPIVAFYSATERLPRVLGHALFHLGRLVTCLVIGAVAGGVGAAVNLAGSLASVQHAAMVTAGLVMVAWGSMRLLVVLGLRRSQTGQISPLLQRLLGLAGRRSPLVQTSLLGLLTPLLPCGWLYAFALAAAGTGHALVGAVLMGAFWAGTLPALLGLGAGLQWLSVPLRRHLPMVTAVALLVIGLVTLGTRWTINPSAAHGATKACHGVKR